MHTFGVQGVVSSTTADVYGSGFGSAQASTDSLLDGGFFGNTVPQTPVGPSPTVGQAMTSTPSASTLNPFFIGVVALLAVALLWKLFHEWGRDEAEFSDIKVGLHNWGAVLILVFAGVPGVKALLQAVPWPWASWAPWQSFVAYCLNA
jgi:hypothetical protein